MTFTLKNPCISCHEWVWGLDCRQGRSWWPDKPFSICPFEDRLTVVLIKVLCLRGECCWIWDTEVAEGNRPREQEHRCHIPGVHELTKGREGGSIMYFPWWCYLPLAQPGQALPAQAHSLCPSSMYRGGRMGALTVRSSLFSLSGSLRCSICPHSIFLKDG